MHRHVLTAVFGMCVCVSHVNAQPGDGPRDGGRAYSDRTILVKWADVELADAARAETPLLLRAVDAEVEWTSRLVPGLAVVRVHSRQVESAQLLALALEGVEYAELDAIVHAADGSPPPCQPVIPNDPAWPQQSWAMDLIKMPHAWRAGTSSTVKVAVLDHGIDYTISDLIPNIAYNTIEQTPNGIDDDNNGVVDDYLGASFLDLSDPQYTLPNDPIDKSGNGHGTADTAIFAARGNNTKRISGVTWQVPAIPVKVLGGAISGLPLHLQSSKEWSTPKLAAPRS